MGKGSPDHYLDTQSYELLQRCARSAHASKGTPALKRNLKSPPAPLKQRPGQHSLQMTSKMEMGKKGYSVIIKNTDGREK